MALSGVAVADTLTTGNVTAWAKKENSEFLTSVNVNSTTNADGSITLSGIVAALDPVGTFAYQTGEGNRTVRFILEQR